tara:strand:+ start:13079 stop:13726 length:648 start_codon:yes stop_codon:yes gene_type:complete
MTDPDRFLTSHEPSERKPTTIGTQATTAAYIQRLGGPEEILAWCRRQHQVVMAQLAPLDMAGSDDNVENSAGPVRDLRMTNAVYRIIYDTLTLLPNGTIEQVYQALNATGVIIDKADLGRTMDILREKLAERRSLKHDQRRMGELLKQKATTIERLSSQINSYRRAAEVMTEAIKDREEQIAASHLRIQKNAKRFMVVSLVNVCIYATLAVCALV